MSKYNKIRTSIKELSAKQIELKAQRKTKTLAGKRTMEPWEAAYKVMLGRQKLMHLFRAYAKLKGFELPKPKHKMVDESLVKALVEKYTEKIQAE